MCILCEVVFLFRDGGEIQCCFGTLASQHLVCYHGNTSDKTTRVTHKIYAYEHMCSYSHYFAMCAAYRLQTGRFAQPGLRRPSAVLPSAMFNKDRMITLASVT